METPHRSRSDQRRLEDFIERMGMLTEDEGLPRIAGRIFGLMLLTPGDLSLDEIAEQLGVSKASVSNDARRLATRGLLERHTRAGDRRDYYSLAPDAFVCSLEGRLERIRRFRSVLDGARTLAAGSTELERRFEQLDVVYDRTVRVLEQVLHETRHASASVYLATGAPTVEAERTASRSRADGALG